MNVSLNEKLNEIIKKYNLDTSSVTDNPRELLVTLLSEITDSSIANIKLGICKVEKSDLDKLEEMAKKIGVDKIPPWYITNSSYIYGLKFFVNENVLIPRQDTETIIEKCIEIITKNNLKSVLDMCTGSGVIGICLAKNTCASNVTLVDISKDALDVARINSKNLGVSDKCYYINSDMFKNLYGLNKKYDIIVSNPPYLTKKEMNEISEYVKKEPSIALDGGRDGLKFYKNIYDNAKFFLNNLGFIAVEIGFTQTNDIIKIISSYSCYNNIEVIKDINGKDRVIVCRFQKE